MMENKGQTGTFVVAKIYDKIDKQQVPYFSLVDTNGVTYRVNKSLLDGWVPKEGETLQALYNPGEFNGKPSHWVTHLQPTVQPVASAEPIRESVEEKVDWSAKDLRMARMSALKTATEIVVALNSFGDNETAKKLIVDNAEYFTKWIYEGRNGID